MPLERLQAEARAKFNRIKVGLVNTPLTLISNYCTHVGICVSFY